MIEATECPALSGYPVFPVGDAAAERKHVVWSDTNNWIHERWAPDEKPARTCHYYIWDLDTDSTPPHYFTEAFPTDSTWECSRQMYYLNVNKVVKNSWKKVKLDNNPTCSNRVDGTNYIQEVTFRYRDPFRCFEVN